MSYHGVGEPEEGWFVTFDTHVGERIRAEIEPTSDGFMPVSAGRPIARLEDLMGPVIRAAGAVVSEARSVHPDEITLNFGIKLTGSGEAVLSRSSADRHFEITLSWNRAQGDAIGRVE